MLLCVDKDFQRFINQLPFRVDLVDDELSRFIATELSFAETINADFRVTGENPVQDFCRICILVTVCVVRQSFLSVLPNAVYLHRNRSDRRSLVIVSRSRDCQVDFVDIVGSYPEVLCNKLSKLCKELLVNCYIYVRCCHDFSFLSLLCFIFPATPGHTLSVKYEVV